MSAKPIKLDNKSRRALTLVGLMLLAVVALALGNFFSARSEQKALDQPVSMDERLVVIDKQTMVVEPGALGNTLAAWLRSNDEKTLSFELSDRSFAANSATPSALTVRRVGQVATVIRARPTITIHILEPAHAASATRDSLEDQRAARLRQELVASGVSQSHVIIEDQRNDLPFAKSPYLAVLLSK